MQTTLSELHDVYNPGGTIDLSKGDVYIGADVTVEPTVLLRGPAVIGALMSDAVAEASQISNMASTRQGSHKLLTAPFSLSRLCQNRTKSEEGFHDCTLFAVSALPKIE